MAEEEGSRVPRREEVQKGHRQEIQMEEAVALDYTDMVSAGVKGMRVVREGWYCLQLTLPVQVDHCRFLAKPVSKQALEHSHARRLGAFDSKPLFDGAVSANVQRHSVLQVQDDP